MELQYLVPPPYSLARNSLCNQAAYLLFFFFGFLRTSTLCAAEYHTSLKAMISAFRVHSPIDPTFWDRDARPSSWQCILLPVYSYFSFFKSVKRGAGVPLLQHIQNDLHSHSGWDSVPGAGFGPASPFPSACTMDEGSAIIPLYHPGLFILPAAYASE